LIAKPSICSSCIAHFTFTSVLRFYFSLIQPLASSLFMCGCRHGLDASGMNLTRCPYGGQQITTHDAIRDIMYAFVKKIGHIVWKEWWYTFTLRVSLWSNLYMTSKNQVFVANVVVIVMTQKVVALSVISWPTSATAKFNAIVKIHNYKGLHEGHHFIPLAMEAFDTLKCDMDRFIKECACLFHNKQLKGYLLYLFAFNFLSNVLILFFNVL
jgi:hypothetical protein